MRLIKRIIRFFFPGCDLRSLIISSFHGVWMIAVSLFWLTNINMFDGFDFMSSVVDYRDLVQNELIKTEKQSDIAEKFLLINTSKSNTLLPLDNDNLTNQVITDRRKLAETLFVLDSHATDIRFVIVDIFFESPSNDTIADSLLQEAISRLDAKHKIIIPKIYVYENGETIYPVYNCTYGTSQYLSSLLNDQYLKYTCIIDDSIKQMPLVAWEKITGGEMKVHHLFGINYYTVNGKWCLNTMIPEFRYEKDDLEEYASYYQMGYFSNYLIRKDQIVILGDFEGIYDSHHSMIDKVPGPLAMLNAYVAIEKNDPVFSWWYFLILFLCFMGISYYSFFQNRISNWYVNNRKLNNALLFLRKRMNFIVIFLLAIVSMLFFHFYLHLLILLTYFGIIEFVIFQIRQYKRRRKHNQLLTLKPDAEQNESPEEKS